VSVNAPSSGVAAFRRAYEVCNVHADALRLDDHVVTIRDAHAGGSKRLARNRYEGRRESAPTLNSPLGSVGSSSSPIASLRERVSLECGHPETLGSVAQDISRSVRVK
jgi:hypothetical protein